MVKFPLLLNCALMIYSLSAQPTEMRQWTSTAGSQMTAKATSLRGDKVALVTEDGRNLSVLISQLSADDQAFLKNHFGSAASLPPAPEAKAPELRLPLGKMIGPISADDDSSYFLYLPTTLVEGIDAPLLFWTGWNQATIERMEPFVEVAELTGMVMAASVEADNGPYTFRKNHAHTEACLDHIKKEFPVDIRRVFFSGSAAGEASAYYNAGILKCAGALPMVAYIPNGTQPNKHGFYYIIGGANDYRRYQSVRDTIKLGERATYRMHAGGHHRPITSAMAFEGTLWLHLRHVYEKADRYPEKLSHFEPRFAS